MKLSNKDVNSFFEAIGLEIAYGEVSIDLLNEIISKLIQYIPWNNLSMIENGLGNVPTLENVKRNMVNGYGGICLDINRFLYYLLRHIGFNVEYILCGREHQEKNHLALTVNIDGKDFFVDCGDAQPCFEALYINSNRTKAKTTSCFLIQNTIGGYKLLRKENDVWITHYMFNLSPCSEEDLNPLINRYYTDIFFGPFWKTLHFAYYPNEKLMALKGSTILTEELDGVLVRKTYSTLEAFELALPKVFSTNILSKYKFAEAIKKLRKINLQSRFGLSISQKEVDQFLMQLGVRTVCINIDFINDFIAKFLAMIPFQNLQMIKRGLGFVPTEIDIKEDMLSMKGGTCATINTFFGAVLYSLGFDVALIHCSMQRKFDHIALLLVLNGKKYIVDVGDGQPYFEAFPTWEGIERFSAFRSFKTVVNNGTVDVFFQKNGCWIIDSKFEITPKAYKDIKATIEQHYTLKEFGPFWSGIRFALFPKREVIAIRDREFIIQQGNSIKRIEIMDSTHLIQLLEAHLPNYVEPIYEGFTKLKLL